LRVIAVGPSFDSLLAESFDEIQSSCKGNLTVMLRMLDGLQTVAGLTTDPCHRRALGAQANQIADLAERTLEAPHERTRFESRLGQLREALMGTKP
jgi:uncharacterized membrane protein